MKNLWVSKKFVFCAILVVFVFLSRVSAQTTLASLEGTIADERGEALPGAALSLKNVETGYSYGSISRADGRYFISGILPGPYTLKVTLSGFANFERLGLVLNIGAKLKIDCTLVPSTIENEITVTAPSPMVEVTKSEISSVVSREQIDNLPLLNRNFTDLAVLKAGIQGSTNSDFDLRSNGLPYGMEEALIDGVSNENASANTYRMTLPADAIQEFRVLTNLFSAEYGNTAGMVRSAITRSGTNQMQGRLAFLLRNEMFDTPNYFVNHTEYNGEEIKDANPPDYQHYNVSGFLGGPIIKDKAHFFLSFESFFVKNYNTVTSPLVAKESVEAPYTAPNVLAKFNYQLNEKNLFTLSTAFRRVDTGNYLVGGLVTKERAVDVIDNRLDLQFSWTYFPSASTINEFRVLYAYNGFDALVSDDKFAHAYAIDRPSGYFGKGESFPMSYGSNRVQLVDNFSLILGDHALKFGLDLHYVTGSGNAEIYQPGQLIFATDDPFNAANPMSYPMVFITNVGDTHYELPQTLASVFVQDSWRATPRLTLNYGLRYNYYTLSDLDIRKLHFPSNINPRFGFSWDPIGDGKTSIRGGIGAYTSNLMGNAAFDIAYMSKVSLSVILFPNYPDPTQPNPWWSFWEMALGLPSGYLASQGQPQSLGTYKAMEGQKAPYTLQATIGAQREIFKDVSVSADFVYAKGYGILRRENENPIIPGTGGLRLDPTKGDIWMVTDGGRSEFKGVYLNFNKRYSQGWALELSYTFGWSKTDSEYIDRIQNYESDGWERQYGYSDTDARHTLSAAGIFDLPWGFQVSGTLYYRSAFPWNALYGYDKNLDGLYSDYVDEFRNSQRDFDHFYINSRLSKYFKIDKFRLQFFAEMYNLTNRANFYQVSNNKISANFGQPTAALDPRLIQLGIRFDF